MMSAFGASTTPHDEDALWNTEISAGAAAPSPCSRWPPASSPANTSKAATATEHPHGRPPPGCLPARRTPDQLTTNLATDLPQSTDETALLDKASTPHIDFPYGGGATAQFTRRIEGGWAR
jgi:hypothetical protein